MRAGWQVGPLQKQIEWRECLWQSELPPQAQRPGLVAPALGVLHFWVWSGSSSSLRPHLPPHRRPPSRCLTVLGQLLHVGQHVGHRPPPAACWTAAPALPASWGHRDPVARVSGFRQTRAPHCPTCICSCPSQTSSAERPLSTWAHNPWALLPLCLPPLCLGETSYHHPAHPRCPH